MNSIGHKLEESEQNKTSCEPLEEFSHIKSYKELALIYKALSEEKGEKLNYEMLLDIENCNSFSCKCYACDVCADKNKKEQKDSDSKMQNCSTTIVNKEKKGCCNIETVKIFII